jgi:hypothetical protein
MDTAKTRQSCSLEKGLEEAHLLEAIAFMRLRMFHD